MYILQHGWLHFFYVKKEVFKEYVKVIHPKYHGPVIDWTTKHPEKKYNKSFYTDDDNVQSEPRQYEYEYEPRQYVIWHDEKGWCDECEQITTQISKKTNHCK